MCFIHVGSSVMGFSCFMVLMIGTVDFESADVADDLAVDIFHLRLAEDAGIFVHFLFALRWAPPLRYGEKPRFPPFWLPPWLG